MVYTYFIECNFISGWGYRFIDARQRNLNDPGLRGTGKNIWKIIYFKVREVCSQSGKFGKDLKK